MALNSVPPDDQFDATIQQGRAVVRLIEAIDVLLRDAAEPEASELRVLQQRYRQRLRAWVAELLPAICTQVWLASDRIQGPEGRVTRMRSGCRRMSRDRANDLHGCTTLNQRRNGRAMMVNEVA